MARLAIPPLRPDTGRHLQPLRRRRLLLLDMATRNPLLEAIRATPVSCPPRLFTPPHCHQAKESHDSIIRVLFMVPIYSTVSFLSYYFYLHAVYFEVLRDCYEAFAIASFFALLCHYIAPDLHEQKNYFRALRPRPWILPISWFRACCGGERGMWRTPRSGLTWFNARVLVGTST